MDHEQQPNPFKQSSWNYLSFRVLSRTFKNGAAYVTRTRDPIITNDVLYQLS